MCYQGIKGGEVGVRELLSPPTEQQDGNHSSPPFKPQLNELSRDADMGGLATECSQHRSHRVGPASPCAITYVVLDEQGTSPPV